MASWKMTPRVWRCPPLNAAYAMSHIDPIGATAALYGPLMDGEHNGIALVEPHDFHP